MIRKIGNRFSEKIMLLANYITKVDKPERAVKAGSYNVIRPAVHRCVQIGDRTAGHPRL
jgi:hypothetical protein